MENIIILIIIVAVFVICRELVCWYWKINSMVKNQEDIINNQNRQISILEEMLKLQKDKS